MKKYILNKTSLSETKEESIKKGRFLLVFCRNTGSYYFVFFVFSVYFVTY